MQMFNDCFPIIPEIILFCGALFSLMYGLFVKNATRHVGVILILMCFAGIFFIIDVCPEYNKYHFISLFNDQLRENDFTAAVRIIILGITVICLIYQTFNKKEKTIPFEVPILTVMSAVGLLFMVASYNLITLYLSMELASIAMYICVASNRKIKLSAEAGLKYFIIGAVSSCVFLFGATIIAIFSPSFSFSHIGGYIFENAAAMPAIFIFGLVMIISALFFKLSAAPFHAWAPDVYVAAPWYVTIFVGSAIKVAVLALLIKFLLCIDLDIYRVLQYEEAVFYNDQIQYFFQIIAVISMIIGTACAIAQKNIKRILAYSSIANMGFILASVSASIHSAYNGGMTGAFIYAILYNALMFIPLFATIGMLRANQNGKNVPITLGNIASLRHNNPYIATMLAILLLSMAGLPPFAGFFGKFFMIMNIMKEHIALALIFIVMAIIGSFYYIRIIKSMFFRKNSKVNVEYIGGNIVAFMLTIFCIINIIYCVAPAYFWDIMNKYISVLTSIAS